MTTTDPQPLEKTYDNLIRIAGDIAIEHPRALVPPHSFINLLRELDELKRYIDNHTHPINHINQDALETCILDNLTIDIETVVQAYKLCTTNVK